MKKTLVACSVVLMLIGGVATVEIPLACKSEGAAGSTYITCPSAANATPDPLMVISTDGSQVNVRRGTDTASGDWDAIVASLKVTTPLTHPIQVNIEQ